MGGCQERMSRRRFLHGGAAAAAGAVLGGEVSVPRPDGIRGLQEPAVAAGFPRQDLSLVERVVRFSHFDLEAVRELVDDRPELAKAAWDWGFGDWETPLGAASHVGRRDIAEFLLGNGARPTIFTFAMLGELETVRAMIRARPGVQRIPGPHGLTLLHHARAGGAPAAEVAAYLEERGDADPRPAEEPLDEDGRVLYLGAYRIEGEDGPFQIVEGDDRVRFRAPGGAPRDLVHRGDGVFHPVGAPGVRLRFEIRGGRARRMTIDAGRRRWTGERVPD